MLSYYLCTHILKGYLTSTCTTLKDIGTSDQYHTNLTRHRIARTLCMLSGMFSHDADKTSYCKISQSLEAARFVFRIVRSLWNLTDTSAALLPTCLSNFRAIRKFNLPISRIRDFTRSYDKKSYRKLKRRVVVTLVKTQLTSLQHLVFSCSSAAVCFTAHVANLFGMWNRLVGPWTYMIPQCKLTKLSTVIFIQRDVGRVPVESIGGYYRKVIPQCQTKMLHNEFDITSYGYNHIRIGYAIIRWILCHNNYSSMLPF